MEPNKGGRKEEMSNTRRIALGLPPLGTPPKPTTQRVPASPDPQKYATQRMATGNTQRLPSADVPPRQSWFSSPAGSYKPGQTQRLMGKQIETKKKLNKLHLALILTVPLLALLMVGFILFRNVSGERIDRKTIDFRASDPSSSGSTASSENPDPAKSDPNARVAPDGTPIEVMKDGMMFKKAKYSTANIKVELPLEYADPTPVHTMSNLRTKNGQSPEGIGPSSEGDPKNR